MVAQVSPPVLQPSHYHHLNPSLLSTNRLVPRILTNTSRSSCASSSSSSSCSSSPATTHTSADSWSLKPQLDVCKPTPPVRRKKASRACGHCQKAHLTCDDGRPCMRCTKRGLSTTCADGVRKKAKYLSDYDDALLVRPRPPIKRNSDQNLEVDDFKKVKIGDDQDCHLSISWAGLDLLENSGMAQRTTLKPQSLEGEILDTNILNQAWALGGLEDWLSRFESGDSVNSHHSTTLEDLVNLHTTTAQVGKPNPSRQRMHEWVERVDRLVEIRKLTMNITADDEWMLKRNLDRSLMELERIISLSGTPTMIWSTSGEILKVGDEFCMLTEWTREELIGKQIEYLFEPESLEEYLDLMELCVFPDQELDRLSFSCSQSSDHSNSSSQKSQPNSASTSSSSSSRSSPVSCSVPLKSLSHSTLNHSSTFNHSHPLPPSVSNKGRKGNDLKQTIKWFGVRKAFGQESIGCSFCFTVRKDLFDCPSSIIANFMPILTKASNS